MPKNPRRLSELEANLSRQERRKSKAWLGMGVGEESGIAEGDGEEGRGSRQNSGPLDAEEMKALVVEKLRRVSFGWDWFDAWGWRCKLMVWELVVEVLVEVRDGGGWVWW